MRYSRAAYKVTLVVDRPAGYRSRAAATFRVCAAERVEDWLTAAARARPDRDAVEADDGR